MIRASNSKHLKNTFFSLLSSAISQFSGTRRKYVHRSGIDYFANPIGQTPVSRTNEDASIELVA